MKIYFNGIIFLRTDKEAAGSGHPVDRIQLDDFFKFEFEKSNFEASYEGFLKWSKVIDYNIEKYLNFVFTSKIIFGSVNPYRIWNNESSSWSDSPSEFHAVRVDDIRNIVLVGVEEHKTKSFEEVYEITL
jgi:hypothetical protein